jgi:mannose-6-phosphate isomerase-like protein (cupin superfamily)
MRDMIAASHRCTTMNEYPTAAQYGNEPVKYPSLQVIDLPAESNAVKEDYRNQVLNRVNDSCLRLSVFQGKYRWHVHPASDELFVVLEGAIVIELQDGSSIRVGPLQATTVPAGVVHRTIGLGRTVNLCFEKLQAETVFLED